MENLMLISVIISSSLLLWLAVKVFYSLWWKPKSLEKQLKQQGIKGTSYKFWHGDLKDYGRMFNEVWSKPLNLTHSIVPYVIPFFNKIVQTHGKITLFWLGTTPTLMIKDPELMKGVLSNKFGYFPKPPQNPHILLFTMGLSTLERQKWVKHRTIINPAFHLEKLKGMMPAFSTSCSMLIDKWEKLVSPEGSYEVDVWPDIQNFTSDVISRAAFGSNYEEGEKIFALQKEQAILVLEAFRSVYIPGFRFLPTKKNKRRMNLDKEIKANLRVLIERKALALRNGESGDDDLLGMLLQSNNQNDLQAGYGPKLSGMTINEVIEECKLFYFAGQETTSTWLTWTMIVLAMHPSWQEKAREEVLHACGVNMPRFENLNNLKIVTMVLYEVLRLYPPVIHQFRYTSTRINIGDISLPAGVQLILPTILIHHDPEVWGDDAEEFKPERFSEGISKASKDQIAFIPFGWGPRICVGQNFAMIEARMALAMILQRFTFHLSPSYAHAPYTVITLQPKHGAQIILHRL
ncbi:Cytochrome p450 [Thalictrum thalictroides]|uniref:Cytochrome p450 n=1 Tax=Thalictrum thalictroides TaxID=46969 RepID=A0A7J6VL83_THATH|nr:Cytochrome p450 [Thalictrum thalictroides]